MALALNLQDRTSCCSSTARRCAAPSLKEGALSAASDILLLVCAAHLLWNFLQCRVYVEYCMYRLKQISPTV